MNGDNSENESEFECRNYDRVMCPKPAYDRLKKARLIELIKKKERVTIDLLLLTDLSGKADKVIQEAEDYILKEYNRISDKSEMFRDILEFSAEVYEEDFSVPSDRFRRETLKHPSLLAYLILGDKIFEYKNLGFDTRRSLEESIASFCIGERVYSFSDQEWVWRRGNYRFEIAQNMHGDLSANQIDVSGQDVQEETLFGKWEKFDTVKFDDRSFTGIYAYQDWSQFLISTLKYAEVIGMAKANEIVNWRNVLEQVGAVGTATAESEFGSGVNSAEMLFEGYDILREGKKIKGFPLMVYCSGKTSYIPYVTNGSLVYLRESKEGIIEINETGTFLDKKRFDNVLEYSPEDIPEILKATYRFFARDRRLLPLIMDRFLEETN